jgi:hypothetical protein
MGLSRRAFLAGLVTGAGALLGCSDKPQGMQNMQPVAGPPIKKDLPLKGMKKKPLPADPLPPKPPPVPNR